MGRIFYILYNHYYGPELHNKKNAIVTVYFIVVVLLFCLCLLLDGIIVLIQDPYSRATYITGTRSFYVQAILGAGVYFVLIYKRRYQAIYEQYKTDTYLNKKAGKVVGWFIIFITILSPFIFALIKNKIVFGNWV